MSMHSDGEVWFTKKSTALLSLERVLLLLTWMFWAGSMDREFKVCVIKFNWNNNGLFAIQPSTDSGEVWIHYKSLFKLRRTVRHISTRVIKSSSWNVTKFSKTMKNKQETLKDFHRINVRFLTLSELKISKTKSIYRHVFHIWFSKLTHFRDPSWSICTCHVTTHPSCPIWFVLSYSTLAGLLILMVVCEAMTTVGVNGEFSYFLSNSP